MAPQAPPPWRHISSTPISVATASQMLAKYLHNAETHPHLHPDALITPTGVEFSSTGGAQGGITMHHLRRVAAGLRGEYMEPDPELEEDEEAGQGSGADTNTYGNGGTKARKGALKKTEWQDMDVYQREEEGIEIGELGPRTNVVQEGGEEPEVEATLSADAGEGRKRKKGAEAGGGEADAAIDQEARKRAKKEKNRQRKREDHEKRVAKKSD